MKLFILTHSPSPYQVELFNTLAVRHDDDLSITYLCSADPERQWGGSAIGHEALMLDSDEERLEESLGRVRDADLAVFNYYNDPFAARLIHARAVTGQPWVFWGERPGFRAASVVGSMFRRWKLRDLHDSRAPIWGIGQFAVDGYRTEFGRKRSYKSIPYFSDLSRFAAPSVSSRQDGPDRVFLFSGALIERKGVELLCRAFVRVASEFPNARLKIMGGGRLRGRLSQMVQPVRNQVEFLGFKDWAELPDVYRTADLLCVPSRYDGWGLVVPEGLAAGLPVIGTNRMGAALEFVETGRNGWLVPSGDEAQLYAALREAASLTGERLSAMSKAARASIADHTLEKGAERFLAACRQAIAEWEHQSCAV